MMVSTPFSSGWTLTTMLILLVVLLGTPKVDAYFEVRATSFILSPAITSLATENTSVVIPRLGNFSKPSYFGFAVSFYRTTEGNARLFVGAPKTSDSTNPAVQDPTGSIESCSITPSIFENGRSNCSSANPPRLHPGDFFGLEADGGNNGSITACSVTRPQDCGALHYIPGTCFSSKNYGEVWSEPLETRSRCPTTNVEVLFVLDGSGSIGKNFDKVKTWVKEISKKISIDEGAVTVGVVQYSHYYPGIDINKQRWIVTEIKIGEYKTYESFVSAVDKIELHGYTTYTGRALQKVVTDFVNTRYYGKVSTKQVMILLTDGKAKDRDLIETNAQKIRNIGVLPFAVGVGDEASVNRMELQLIATGDAGNDTRVYMTANFDGLDAIAGKLGAEIGGLVLEGGAVQNGTGYKLQFGQLGLSIAYSKTVSQLQRRDNSSQMRQVISPPCFILAWCVWF